MRPSAKFKFGAWLPDQPDLDNPGLIEANNTVFRDGSYGPYKPFAVTGGSVDTTHAIAAFRASGSGASNLYVAGSDGFQSYLDGGAGAGNTLTNLTGPGLFPSDYWSFTQYGATVIATNGRDHPQYNPLTLGPFAKLTGTFGDAPIARVVGTVGQFVVLGNLPGAGPGFGATMLQWSGIDAPFDWPTPTSASAIAEQSGSQFLDYRLGSIEAVCEGDQWAVVLLDGGVVRMTYQGGGTVFQFDTIHRGPAAICPNAWVKVSGNVYFISAVGILLTDGTQVVAIGDGKVDRWFMKNADFTFPWAFSAGVDYKAKVIFWTFPLTGNSGVPNAWIAYNYKEDRFTHGTDSVKVFVRGEEAWVALYGHQAFSNAGNIGNFFGTPGTAVFTSPEVELNPGGRTLVQGVMPQVSGSSPVVTVRVGSRNGQGDAVAFSSVQSPDSFTQSANFLVDSRYHRAEISIAGDFTQALGGEFDAQPSSSV